MASVTLRELRNHGGEVLDRTTKARAYDALIAASALALDVPLYTCNPRDFAGVDGLAVHAVTHPDH